MIGADEGRGDEGKGEGKDGSDEEPPAPYFIVGKARNIQGTGSLEKILELSGEMALRVDGKSFGAQGLKPLVCDWSDEAGGRIEPGTLVKTERHESAPTKDADPTSYATFLKSGELSLHTCLHKFATEEQLDEHNEWYCSECKEHKQAFEKVELFK